MRKIEKLTDAMWEELKKELFNNGTNAIEDFLGFQILEYLDKDSINNELEEIKSQMSDDTQVMFYKKYVLNNKNTSKYKKVYFDSYHKLDESSMKGCFELNLINESLVKKVINAVTETGQKHILEKTDVLINCYLKFNILNEEIQLIGECVQVVKDGKCNCLGKYNLPMSEEEKVNYQWAIIHRLLELSKNN